MPAKLAEFLSTVAHPLMRETFRFSGLSILLIFLLVSSIPDESTLLILSKRKDRTMVDLQKRRNI